MKIQNVGTLVGYFKFKNEMSVFDNKALLFCTRFYCDGWILTMEVGARYAALLQVQGTYLSLNKVSYISRYLD